MQELDKGLAVALSGALAEQALVNVQEQLAAWGLVMPDVPPLVLDFGLGRFSEVGETEFWVANEVAAGYCGKFLFVFDGQTCPLHRHAEKHETFYIVKGRVRMVLGEEARELAEGAVLPVTPGVYHSFTGLGAALLLEVSKPCLIDDNYFSDPSIPLGGNFRSSLAQRSSSDA